MLLAIAAVLSTMHYEGDVPPSGGDFALVAFEVPAGTVEIQISHSDGSDTVILDWGVWGPDGFRGWGGGNTEDAIIGVAESSRSYLPGPITPGTWTVVVGKALIGAGARYSIDVVCRDDATLPVRPRAATEPVVLATGRRWYKGDLHVHSSESGDANASFDQIASLAAQRGLDFVNLSEHNTDSHVALAAAAQAQHPSVLLLRGAEITTYAGHGNAVGLGRYVDHRIGHDGRTIGQILDEVAAQQALFIVNHPALELGDNCIGCAWKHADTPWDKVAGIEILTGKWDIVERLFTPQAIRLWDELEDQGHRLAAVGGSDDHRAGAGTGANDSAIGGPTTLVLADELGEAAILEGIRRGRTIVQLTGPDDPLVELRLGEAELGDDVDGVKTAELDVTVTGGAGDFVQLWRDGEKIGQIRIAGDAFTHRFTDEPGEGPHRYRVEVINAGNQRLVVTSHIYVRGVAATGEGCGCASGREGWPLLPVALVALALVLVPLRRRARRCCA